MRTITHESLTVRAPFDVEGVHSFAFNVHAYDHANAKLILMVKDSSELLQKDYTFSTVTILANERVLFAGVLTKLSVVDHYTDRHLIEIELSSASIILDQARYNRSFQDKNQCYRDILDMVLSHYSNAHYILEKTDREIGEPIIQYNETDWQFAKRLASHFSSSIIPIFETAIPGFSLGLPITHQRATANLQGHDYDVVISNHYHPTHENAKGYNPSRISTVMVETTQNLDIGDQVYIANQHFKIYQKAALLVDEELIFTYSLSRADLLYSQKYYNQCLLGRSLTGRIIDVEKDLLKLHLDIDEAQDKAEAFWFRWTPITGNLFYLMPELGERVNLYFHDGTEGNGQAISCVRNPAIREAGILSEPSMRQLQTKDRKKMTLYPRETGYISETSNTSVMLTDSKGISFDSPKSVSILAGGKIMANSQIAYFFTPTNLGLYAIGTGDSITSDAEPLASIDFSGPTVSMFSKYGKASLKFKGGKSGGASPARSDQSRKATGDEFSKVYAGYTMAGSLNDSSVQETQAIVGSVATTAAPMQSGASSSQAGGGPSVGLTIGGSASMASALLPASLKPLQKGQAIKSARTAEQVLDLDRLKSITRGKSAIIASHQGKPLLDQVLKASDSEENAIAMEKIYAPGESATQVLNHLRNMEQRTSKSEMAAAIRAGSDNIVKQCSTTENQITQEYIQDVYSASVEKQRLSSASIASVAEALALKK